MTIAIALGAAAILFRRQVVVKARTAGCCSGRPRGAVFDIRGSVDNDSAPRVT